MEEIRDEHLKIGFFTASILNWKSLLKPAKYKNIITNSFDFLVRKNRAKIYGFVIMPNHIHFLWKIISPFTLDQVQRDFLKYTSQMIKFDLKENHHEVLKHFWVNLRDREYQFWQNKPLNKLLDSRKIVEQKLDYIHNNPLKGRWMLADSPEEYFYSSYRYYEFEDKLSFPFLEHYMSCFE
jgi:REP element-mobilizing transposase RayT